MSDYTPEQRARLLDAMQRHEGWRVGRRTAESGGGVSGARENFPRVRTREDYEGASGAQFVPFPGHWNDGAKEYTAGERMLAGALGPRFGLGGPQGVKAEGSVSIHLEGGLKKTSARVESDGMFKDVRVIRGSQVATA